MSRKPDPDAIWDCRNPDSKPSQQLANARWCWIPGPAAIDNRLKLIHWRFLAYIGRQNADHGWIKVSQTNLAKEWGCTRQHLNACIRDLVKWAYVEQTTQSESGDTWCCYRVRADGPTGVSDTGDTSEVSGSDDNGVSVAGQGCASADDTLGDHSLYLTVNPDKPVPHASHEGDAQARPLPDDHPVVDAEIVSPREAKPRRKRKPNQQTLDGEPVKIRTPRSTLVPFPDDLDVAPLLAFAAQLRMSDDEAQEALATWKLKRQAKGERNVDWEKDGQGYLLRWVGNLKKQRTNGSSYRGRPSLDELGAEVFGHAGGH